MCGASHQPQSCRDGPKDQTRNLEIPGSRCARRGMTNVEAFNRCSGHMIVLSRCGTFEAPGYCLFDSSGETVMIRFGTIGAACLAVVLAASTPALAQGGNRAGGFHGGGAHFAGGGYRGGGFRGGHGGGWARIAGGP